MKDEDFIYFPLKVLIRNEPGDLLKLRLFHETFVQTRLHSSIFYVSNVWMRSFFFWIRDSTYPKMAEISKDTRWIRGITNWICEKKKK